RRRLLPPDEGRRAHAGPRRSSLERRTYICSSSLSHARRFAERALPSLASTSAVVRVRSTVATYRGARRAPYAKAAIRRQKSEKCRTNSLLPATGRPIWQATQTARRHLKIR